MLKEVVTSSYDALRQSGGTPPTTASIEQAARRMDSLFVALTALRESAPSSRQDQLARAVGIAGSINDQRLRLFLQLNDSLSWPFMAILVSWTCLLFFGFGTLAQVNRASVLGLMVGAVSVASAIFLIVELSTPYSGLLKMSPAPIRQTIEALGK
jgi:lipopolysaccharide export LptBFGC system permease protein LptF